MAINQSIWGAPETWQDITATLAAQGELKIGEASHTTYNNAWTSERLPWNSFDKSPAFWGIGANSILCNPHYIAPYCVGGDITDIDVYTEPLKATKKSEPCIFTKNADSILSPRWNYRYKPWETPSSSPIDPACSRDVILSFNYQKVILVPYVIVTTDSYTSGGTSSYTLYDYVENARYTTYQQVLGFGYILRFGDGIDSNRTSQTNGYLMPIISYDISGRNIYYNNHPFYAHTTGMSILAWHRLDDMGISIERVRGDATVGTEDTGFRWRYCPTNDGTSVPWFFYDPDEPLWEINKKTHTASGVTYWYAYPCIKVTANNIDNVKSYIMSQIAFLGLPFVYNPTDANRGQIGDLGVYLPKFDTDGVTTGEYEEGAAALRLPNSDWTDGRTGSGYDPTRKPGEDDFGDLSNRRPTRVSPGGLNLYVTNYQTIYNLQRYLNGAYTPSAADLTADFKGTNPGDYIVSAFKFPVALPANQTLEEIYIGKIPSGFQAYRLTDNAYLDFGTIDIDPYFSTTIDFRDYQSKILLFMPFIGTAELDPKAFIGHSLSLIYNVDYLTGYVAAEIKRDGLTIETRTAKLAQTVPFFAGNMGAYQNEIAQTGFAIEQSKIKQITGAVTTMFSIGGAAATAAGGGSELAGLGSGAGIIRGASNMLLERINQESLEYRLEHTQPQIGTISTASAGNAFLLDDRARVLIWRPYMLPGYDPETYSHVVGNATLRAAALSEFSGYTVAAAADLSNVYTIDGTKSASEQELKLIKQALLAGVYV